MSNTNIIQGEAKGKYCEHCGTKLIDRNKPPTKEEIQRDIAMWSLMIPTKKKGKFGKFWDWLGYLVDWEDILELTVKLTIMLIVMIILLIPFLLLLRTLLILL